MKFLKRTIYLVYYFKQMKWNLLKKFLNFTSQDTGRSKVYLMTSAVGAVYCYNISILEYFQFHFFELSNKEKKSWAGTGTMYEFQLKANPKTERHILENKLLFHQKYGEFFKHDVFSIEELKSNAGLIEQLLKDHQKLVLKEVKGLTGSGVEIIETVNFAGGNLISYMERRKYEMLETFIKQHPSIQKLAPTAVNTIRIFTQIRKDGMYEVLGARMRISVNSPVDNMAAGNLAAPINQKTGVINGSAVYSDMTKPAENVHPVTKISIIGFKIPKWEEVLEIVERASLKYPQNRSIGWDVVITEDGPGLIEGNHDWCKLVWQLPVKKGLKNKLESY